MTYKIMINQLKKEIQLQLVKYVKKKKKKKITKNWPLSPKSQNAQQIRFCIIQIRNQRAKYI